VATLLRLRLVSPALSALRGVVRARAPPPGRLAALAGGAALALFGALHPALLGDVAALAGELVRTAAERNQRDAAATARDLVKITAAAGLAAALAHRYVLRRQTSNVEKGWDRSPRRDAARAAAVVGVLAAGYGAVRLLVFPTPLPFAVELALVGAAAVVAGLMSALQPRNTGRVRTWLALVAAGWAGALSLVVPGPVTSPVAATGAEWWAGFLVVTSAAGLGTILADLVTARYGAWRAGKATAKLNALRAAVRDQPGGAPSAGQLRRLREARQELLDLHSISAFHLRATLLKIDAPLGAGLGYVILRPWPGDEAGWPILVRIGAGVAFLAVVDPLRNRIERNYYGFRSPKEGRRLVRARWWWGPHVPAAAADLRSRLEELRGAGGRHPVSDVERNRLADELADTLADLLTTPAVDAFEAWTGGPRSDAVAAARSAERRQARARQRQHLVAVAHAVALLDATARGDGRTERVAARWARAGRPDVQDAFLLARAVLERLHADPRVARLLPPGPVHGWGDRLLEQVTVRNEMRGTYFHLRRRLLEELRGSYGLGSPERRLLEHELEQLAADQAREDLRPVELDPLTAAAQLLDERVRSLADGTRTRLPQQRRERILAAHRVLHATALLHAETTRERAERRATAAAWRRNLGAAAAGPRRVRPDSPLGVLLTVVGRGDPVTAADLVALHQGRPGDWQERLTVLQRAGAVTGNRDDGYRASSVLGERWAAADPPLRRALRRDPFALPGTDALRVLATDGAPRRAAAQAAVRDLADLLRHATAVFRDPASGPGYELTLLRARVSGWIDQARRDQGLVDEPLSTQPTPATRPGWRRVAAQERAALAAWLRLGDRAQVGEGVALLDRHREQALAAERLHRLELRAAVLGAAAVGRGPRGPPTADDRALLAGRRAQTEVFAALSRARADTVRAADEAGVLPHVRNRMVDAADRALVDRPGADPARPAVRGELGRARTALVRARTDLELLLGARDALARSGTPAAVDAVRELERGPLPDAVRAATLVLEQHVLADSRAWEANLFRELGGWRQMVVAREAADALGELLGRVRLPAVGPAAQPDVVPVDRDGGTMTVPGDPVGAAAGTVRGRGEEVDEDAATVGRNHDGTAWFAVVADGLSAGDRSERASAAAVRAARAVLLRQRAGDDPEATVRRAFAAATDAVAALGALGSTRPPATTLAVTLLTPSPGAPGSFLLHVAWAGDTRVYWVPAGSRRARALTADHVRADALVRWLAADSRPGPEVRRVEAGAGTVLVLTDGMLEALDRPEATLAAVPHGDPAAAVSRLLNAVGASSRPDDHTVAALGVARATRPTGAPGRRAAGSRATGTARRRGAP
jgi:serine/threonine protein phosphatase PrpC